MDKPLLFPKRESKVRQPNFQLTNTTDIVVERNTGSGSFVDGLFVQGAAELVEMKANVQPMKGYDLIALPESDRSKEWIKVYTTEYLYTVDESSSTVPDIIQWNGKRYRVTSVMRYTMGVLDHTKALAYRLPLTPDNQAVVMQPEVVEYVPQETLY